MTVKSTHDRHFEQAVDAVTGGPMTEHGIVERVTALLDRFDVPVADPTARHLELAERTVRGGTMAADGVVERVAELLAAEDARRVPVEAVGAAFIGGRRDALAGFLAWLQGDGYRTGPDAGRIDPDAALIALDAYAETVTVPVETATHD